MAKVNIPAHPSISSLVGILFILLSPLITSAALELPAIFGNNMAIQAEAPIRFWGSNEPEQSVTVRFRNNKGDILSEASTMPETFGNWKLELTALPMGIKGSIEIKSSCGEERIIQNVITADVWLASGQSNMEWYLRKAKNGPKHAQEADFPDIRIFKVERNTAKAPEESIITKAGWIEVSPENVDLYSAIGFYFTRELHTTLQQPMGLICAYWGGTRAEAWTPTEALATLTKTMPYAKKYAKAVAEKDQSLAKWQQDLTTWEAGEKKGNQPRRPSNFESRHRPSALFNGMIAPIIPYAIKGAIWYQGESNWVDHVAYRTLFPAMIDSWRQAWGLGDFPFGYVELANYKKPQTQPLEGDWAFLRYAQRHALEMPNVFMASANDLGEADNIHPTDKETVGVRLARAALEQVYKHPAGASSPRVISTGKQGNRFIAKVINVYGGLTVKDPTTHLPFAIKDKQGAFHWAQAEIKGDQITIWNDAIEDPVAAYYAWAANPSLRIYNSEGLPLLSFRTDLTEEIEQVRTLYQP